MSRRRTGRRGGAARALLASLLVHALLLSLSFGGEGLGLPGLALPWQARRAEVPDLRVVLVAPPAAPLPAPEPVEPVKPAVQAGATEETTEGTTEEVTEEAPPPMLAAPAEAAAPALIAVERPVETPWSVPAALPASAPVVAAFEGGGGSVTRLHEAADTALDRDSLTRGAAALAQLDDARREAQQQARQQAAALAEAERQEAERQEAARQEAARLEAERQDALRKLEAARLEAARLDAERRAAAQREAAEAARADAARQEAARQEAARQESMRADAARQQAAQAAQAEAARLAAAKAAAASAEAQREARLRAIGRQLDEEAARRDAVRQAQPALPSSWSSLRRGRLFGRADANAEMVLYAEAWARKIQLNPTFDLVREAVQQPHDDPLVTVAIRADGTVESVSFVRSSGVPALDEAVRRVVESQANYPAFPPALAREYDVIEIRRTWRFDTAIRLY